VSVCFGRFVGCVLLQTIVQRGVHSDEGVVDWRSRGNVVRPIV
jgi:hypothetical protein